MGWLNVFYAVLSASLLARFGAAIEVDTPVGSIDGNALEYDDGEIDIVEFLGVPYAEPPTGDLRFRPAVQVDKFESEPLDATEYGPVCLQEKDFVPIFPGLEDLYGNGTTTSPSPGNFAQSEDCLNLNIWAPSSEIVDQYGSVPVLFWLHGGAWVFGSGSLFNSTQIVKASIEADQPLIVVTINYRLGALGLLALDQFAEEDPSYDSTMANNFMSDIITALKFTREIIPSFGGDAGRITIAGQSSGGMAVCMLCFLPEAEGLFANAIIESGACSQINVKTKEYSKNVSDTFISDVLGKDPDTVTPEDLRAMPGDKFVDESETLEPSEGDGVVIPENMMEDLENLKVVPSRVLIGTNVHDSTRNPPSDVSIPGVNSQPETAQDFEDNVVNMLSAQGQGDEDENQKLAEEIVEKYTSPETFENLGIEIDEDNFGYTIASEGFWKMRGDAMFGCRTEVVAKIFSDSVDTWQYYFVGPEPIKGGHGGEVNYVFGTKNFEDTSALCSPDDPTLCHIAGSVLKNSDAAGVFEKFQESLSRDLTDEIMDTWRNFIYGQNPGWPKFTRENQYYRQFGPGDEVTTQEGSRPGCDLLLELYPDPLENLT